MGYEEKLGYVLETVALVSQEDLEKIYNLTASMTRVEDLQKIQRDRAALCSYIPYLNENDTELLCISARMCKKPQ